MKASEMFSTSVVCPKCGKALDMIVSDLNDYAYQCTYCNENFHSFECPDTVSDCENDKGEVVPLYEITFHGQSLSWYKRNYDAINIICHKYGTVFLGCDSWSNYCDPDNVLIDFGWGNPPTEKQIHGLANEIMELI